MLRAMRRIGDDPLAFLAEQWRIARRRRAVPDPLSPDLHGQPPRRRPDGAGGPVPRRHQGHDPVPRAVAGDRPGPADQRQPGLARAPPHPAAGLPPGHAAGRRRAHRARGLAARRPPARARRRRGRGHRRRGDDPGPRGRRRLPVRPRARPGGRPPGRGHPDGPGRGRVDGPHAAAGTGMDPHARQPPDGPIARRARCRGRGDPRPARRPGTQRPARHARPAAGLEPGPRGGARRDRDLPGGRSRDRGLRTHLGARPAGHPSRHRRPGGPGGRRGARRPATTGSDTACGIDMAGPRPTPGRAGGGRRGDAPEPAGLADHPQHHRRHGARRLATSRPAPW